MLGSAIEDLEGKYRKLLDAVTSSEARRIAEEIRERESLQRAVWFLYLRRWTQPGFEEQAQADLRQSLTFLAPAQRHLVRYIRLLKSFDGKLMQSLNAMKDGDVDMGYQVLRSAARVHLLLDDSMVEARDDIRALDLLRGKTRKRGRPAREQAVAAYSLLRDQFERTYPAKPRHRGWKLKLELFMGMSGRKKLPVKRTKVLLESLGSNPSRMLSEVRSSIHSSRSPYEALLEKLDQISEDFDEGRLPGGGKAAQITDRIRVKLSKLMEQKDLSAPERDDTVRMALGGRRISKPEVVPSRLNWERLLEKYERQAAQGESRGNPPDRVSRATHAFGPYRIPKLSMRILAAHYSGHDPVREAVPESGAVPGQ